MPRETEIIIDFDNPRERQLLLEQIRSLHGMHRICVLQYRPRRSDRQNRFYWPCFVQPLHDYLRAQGWEGTEDDAHELMKAKFLRASYVDTNTGESFEYVRSSASLTVEEFTDYLERCAAWLAEMFGIVVPESYTEAA